MQQYPKLIKRPVIQFENKIEIGFDQQQFTKLFF